MSDLDFRIARTLKSCAADQIGTVITLLQKKGLDCGCREFHMLQEALSQAKHLYSTTSDFIEDMEELEAEIAD